MRLLSSEIFGSKATLPNETYSVIRFVHPLYVCLFYVVKLLYNEWTYLNMQWQSAREVKYSAQYMIV